MRLKINGKELDLPEGINVKALIAHLNISAERVAIELNKEIAKKSEWEKILLKDGDILEIVSFVGGG